MNQATSVAVALVTQGAISGEPIEVATYIEELAPLLVERANDLQATELASAGFAGTTAEAAPAEAPQGRFQRRTQQAAAPAARPAQSSGGRKAPIDVNDASLPQWLKTQCKAKGVTKVWDNTDKPNYIAAIESGADKTPPPYRSATDGIEAAFWPPKG
jgi:hypothetical protein